LLELDLVYIFSFFFSSKEILQEFIFISFICFYLFIFHQIRSKIFFVLFGLSGGQDIQSWIFIIWTESLKFANAMYRSKLKSKFFQLFFSLFPKVNIFVNFS
jgi:hypothetical protein